MERAMSTELRKKIVADYEAGKLSVKEVAEKHDVTPSSVRNAVHKAGSEVRFPRATEEEKKEIVRLYVEEKWPSPKIAEKFGKTPVGIRLILKSAGVEIQAGVMKRAMCEEEEAAFVERCGVIGVAAASSEKGITMQGGYKIMKRRGGKVKSPQDRVAKHGTQHNSMRKP